MPEKTYRPRLAWFTITKEDKDVFHTCWDCPKFVDILEANTNVTLVKWAEEDRDHCHPCSIIQESMDCCETYPCSGMITLRTKAVLALS